MSDTTPTPNDLGRVITNPSARALIYAAYVIILTVAGATTVGFAVLDAAIPAWLIVANAVLGYLGLPISGLALANIKSVAVVPAATTSDDITSVNPENI